MRRKPGFAVRMYDASRNRCEVDIAAASDNQALMLAMSEPRNELYIHFGLIGADGNCHKWIHRAGAPRINPERMGGMRERDTTPVKPVRPQDASAPDPKILHSPTTPIVVTKATLSAIVDKLSEVAMTRALPQLSSTDTFTARSLGEKLPLAHQPQWTALVWPKVISRMIEVGAVTKAHHKNYRRVHGFVFTPTPADDAPVIAPSNGNGAHPPANPEARAAPQVVVASQIPSTPDLEERMLTADDKVEAVLLLIKAVLLDNRHRQQSFKALADRLVDAMALVDGIRTDLESMMKAESELPMRAGEIITQLRRPPLSTVQPSEGAH